MYKHITVYGNVANKDAMITMAFSNTKNGKYHSMGGSHAELYKNKNSINDHKYEFLLKYESNEFQYVKFRADGDVQHLNLYVILSY